MSHKSQQERSIFFEPCLTSSSLCHSQLFFVSFNSISLSFHSLSYQVKAQSHLFSQCTYICGTEGMRAESCNIPSLHLPTKDKNNISSLTFPDTFFAFAFSFNSLLLTFSFPPFFLLSVFISLKVYKVNSHNYLSI